MRIIAHRGFWRTPEEKNSINSILEAIKNGYGFETDLRDYHEKLVVSHNIADASSPEADSVFAALKDKQGQGIVFAINIKCDGIAGLIKEQIKKYGIEDYFVFDMSIPQTLEYKDAEIIYFARQSEFENTPVLYDGASGVWVDGFESTDWITEELIRGHLNRGKMVCIVSPELHKKRDYTVFWNRLKNMRITQDSLLLCTDYPDEAKEFFYGKEN